jgi:tetratricopeptide (TPR) repeat protein
MSEALENDSTETWQLAEKAWRQVLARHPMDGETLANLARTLDEQEMFEQAREYHERAIVASGNRENKYGVFYGVAMHWVRQGIVASSNRMPEEALYSFQQADDFLSESYERNYRRRDLGRALDEWLKKRIDFLEGARIESEKIPGLTLERALDKLAQSR